MQFTKTYILWLTKADEAANADVEALVVKVATQKRISFHVGESVYENQKGEAYCLPLIFKNH